MKRSIFVAAFFIAGLSAATAQAPPPAPPQDGKQPDVFLDTNRPLIGKKNKAPTSRTVSGIVTDDTGRPLVGALVTVTALKNNEKHDYFTKKDGRYSFDDLAFTEDYQVQAKWKKLISEPRKISQYDHSAKVVRLLQVQTPEGYSAQPAAAADVKKEAPKK
jgi:hypothetical protein